MVILKESKFSIVLMSPKKYAKFAMFFIKFENIRLFLTIWTMKNMSAYLRYTFLFFDGWSLNLDEKWLVRRLVLMLFPSADGY